MKQYGWYVFGAVILSMVVLGMIVGDGKKSNSPVSTSNGSSSSKSADKTQTDPIADKFTETMVQFANQRPDQQWLFTGDAIEGKDLDKFVSVSKLTIQKAENSFKTYSQIPEVKKFGDQFSGKLFMSMFSSNTNAPMMMGRGRDAFKGFGDPAYLEICLFDSKARNDPRNQFTLISFNPAFNAMMIAGIDFKEPWFSAFFLHEMYHVRKFREDAESSKKNQYGTDLWISEEVEAHLLETKILDSATKGKYLQAVKTIIDKRESYRDPDMLPSSLTIEELNSLDALFPASSKDESSFRLAQYIVTIGFTWLEKRFSGSELQKKQIDYYRSVTSRFG